MIVLRINDVKRILKDTAYPHTAASPEEMKCLSYLQAVCERVGLTTRVEAFPIERANIRFANLIVDGAAYPCKAYIGCGSGKVEAPLYYLRDTDALSLSLCRDRIVLTDQPLKMWTYQDMLENGALGFITFTGRYSCPDRDIDQKTLRPATSLGKKILGVNINVKDAMQIVARNGQQASIEIDQEAYEADAHNLIAELPGEIDEWIVLTAHYDSTPLSCGSYDNMTGSIGILGVAERFIKAPHRRGLRFIWCGGEELGLLGSKAYCADHEDELGKVVLNINLDMIGSIMGKFIACCSAEERLVSFLEYTADELGFPIAARSGVYSSDSTPFADKGVPSLSFARLAPPTAGSIHERYDTPAIVSEQQVVTDIEFIAGFTGRMANAVRCPVKREIPDKIKDKLDVYLNRKRAPKPQE
ncbi:MAG: Zn-dependent exopeptidase M28 [Clostridia bacterium]|nr:Zn-dependent exopeptidase M28 [Clostridia bacterium]